VPVENFIPVDTVNLVGDQDIRLSTIMSVVLALLLTLRSCARSRAVLQLEVLALRHQLQVLNRSRPRRLRLAQADRLLRVWLSRVWNEWPASLVIVKQRRSLPGTAAPSVHLLNRVAVLEDTCSEMKRTLDVQFQRIAAIQAQLDHIAARLSER
jgi:hypothetical protein